MHYGIGWVAALFICVGVIKVFAPFAKRVRLVDVPDLRKRHVDEVPLIGGIAVFVTTLLIVTAAALMMRDMLDLPAAALLPTMLGGGLLLLTGVVDDFIDLGKRWRILMTAGAALIFTVGTGFEHVSLGDLFGFGSITLWGWQATAFVAVCVFGMVNAFNMLDGVDGVLGLNLVAAAVGFHWVAGIVPAIELVVVIGAICGYLVANLGLSNRIPRVFMGDSGSMLVGFLMAVFLLSVASTHFGNPRYLSPVTALFIVGLPLVDMVTVTLRRLLEKRSPFSPGRDHFHHLMLTLCVSKHQAIAVITLLGACYPVLGAVMLVNEVTIFVQFWTIFSLGVTHFVVTTLWWRRIESRRARSEATIAAHV